LIGGQVSRAGGSAGFANGAGLGVFAGIGVGAAIVRHAYFLHALDQIDLLREEKNRLRQFSTNRRFQFLEFTIVRHASSCSASYGFTSPGILL
jgi:hypothetical protein